MSGSFALSPAIVGYLNAHNPPEHPVLQKCREETAPLPRASFQIGPETGAVLNLLARTAGAKRAIEVGVFTGYSALVVALAMREMHGAGYLLACDVSEDYTRRARAYWREAGVEGLVDLHLGPAIATLDARIAAGEEGAYDFAFIDADKTAYPGYYERCLQLLRPGGLMVLDNMLWSGAVADPSVHDPDTEELRAVARRAAHDARVDQALVAVGDGLLICRKR